MKKELKITFLTQLKNLQWFFYMTIGYYIFVYIIFQDLNIFFSKDYYYTHLWIVWQIMVVLYIHISYFIENKNSNYSIDKNYIIDNRNQKKISNTEILKIIIHKSSSLRKNGYVVAPFQYYKYCEVLLKNGNKIILTSLLKYDIDEYLKENLKGVLFENDDSNFSYFL